MDILNAQAQTRKADGGRRKFEFLKSHLRWWNDRHEPRIPDLASSFPSLPTGSCFQYGLFVSVGCNRGLSLVVVILLDRKKTSDGQPVRTNSTKSKTGSPRPQPVPLQDANLARLAVFSSIQVWCLQCNQVLTRSSQRTAY